MRRLALALALLLSGAAAAQLEARGDVTWAADAALSEAFPARVGWTLSGHLDLAWTRDALELRAVLDPRLRADPGAEAKAGLTEAYARVTFPAGDVTAGRARLPLETARLGLPLTVEDVREGGARRGVTGLQVRLYRFDTRLRAALLTPPDRSEVTPVLGVRHRFGGFELEAHALHPGRPVLGLGGSGLAGDVVVYGEGWLLARPWGLRGALGANGLLGDGSWTLEAGYAPADPAAASEAPSRPTVDGRVSLPLDDAGERTLALRAGGRFPEGATEGTLGATWTHAWSDRTVTLDVGSTFGPSPMVVTGRVAVTGYF